MPADAAALAEVERGIYREGRWFVGDDAPGSEQLRSRLRVAQAEPARSLWLLAEVDGEVAGWLELHRLRPQRLGHVASLTLAVAAGHRRLGLGRRMLRAGFAWADRVAVRKIRLDVRAGNTAALALYRAEGFVEEGRERGQIRTADGYEENIVMARFLGGAGSAPR